MHDASRDEQVEALYGELRTLARSHLRSERSEHTLTPTALVSEAYLRLARARRLDPAERTLFLGAASRTMRRVLVDHARRRSRLKRGGDRTSVPLEDVAAWLTDEQAEELVALDEALDRLAAASARSAQVVQHRFFGGLSLEETAELLGLSVKTVQRDWLAARAWLRKEIARDVSLT